LERTKVVDNALLGRKEATYVFKGSSGLLSRAQAVKMVASDLGAKEESIVPVSFKGRHGSRDLVGTFYLFEDMKVARAQLPKYMFLRSMSREERKKFFEERRKGRTKKVAAPAQKKA